MLFIEPLGQLAVVDGAAAGLVLIDLEHARASRTTPTSDPAEARMSRASQTPVMRQYLAAKAAHPDALLFFRMGDFYELFFEDAVVAARALDLTLTARNKGSDDEIPMAGVPHHAASAYVQRLLEQGFKVAICEQMADPSKVKGLVPREVVRVVTPGIAFDDAGLDARQNHYLAAVERDAAPGRPSGGGARPVDGGALGVRGGGRGGCAGGARAPRPARGARRARARRSVAKPLAAGCGARAVVRVAHEADRRTRTRVLDAQLGAGEARASCASAVGAARGGAVRRDRAGLRGGAAPARRAPRRSTCSATRSSSTRRRRPTSSSCASVDGGERGSLARARSTRRRPRPERASCADACSLRSPASPRSAAGTTPSSSSSPHPGTRAELRDGLAEVGDVERLAVKLALDRASPRDLVALRRSLAVLPASRRRSRAAPSPDAREALGVAGRRAAGSTPAPTCTPCSRAPSPTSRPRGRATAASSATASTAELDEARELDARRAAPHRGARGPPARVVGRSPASSCATRASSAGTSK